VLLALLLDPVFQLQLNAQVLVHQRTTTDVNSVKIETGASRQCSALDAPLGVARASWQGGPQHMPEPPDCRRAPPGAAWDAASPPGAHRIVVAPHLHRTPDATTRPHLGTPNTQHDEGKGIIY
jgi:hypothetical protein